MGTSYTHQLACALGPNRTDNATLRLRIHRLAQAVIERTHSPDRASLEFVKSGVDLLQRVHPPVSGPECYASMAKAVPYLYAQGEFAKARSAATLMHRIAHYLSRKDLLRQADNFRGVIEKTLGNMADAVVHYQSALSLAQEIGDLHGEASTLTNLASAFYEVGLYGEAEACIRRVIALPSEGLARQRAISFHNLAAIYSRAGRRQEAIRAARQSCDESPEPTTIEECFSLTLREANYIFLILDLENTNELNRHLQKCRLYATRSATRLAACFFRLAEGMCVLQDHGAERGITILTEVLYEANHLAHPGLVEDALAALAWGHELRGEPTEALTYIRRLINCVADRRRRCLDVLEEKYGPLLDEGSRPDLLPLRIREAKLEAAAIKLESRAARLDLLQRLAMTATLRDDPSGMHGFRVGKLAALLAANLGWSPDCCYELEAAARLHDIGKSAVPDHILLGKGPLRNAERDFVRSHPEIGSSLLVNASAPESRLAADIALYHHEHWNGNGYPRGLSAHRIPLAARIVAIADVFDALTHGRSYAAPWPVDKAVSELRALSGSQFDPDLIEPFIGVISTLVEKHGDLDAFLEAKVGATPFESARKKIEAMILNDRQRLETAAKA